MRSRGLISVSLIALTVACRQASPGQERAAPSSSAPVVPTPLVAASSPSASASPTPSEPPGPSSAAAAASAGEPFEVRPTVQTKTIRVDSNISYSVIEPGVLIGPKKQLIKAFDCVSAGAPRANAVGTCVRFQACVAATVTEPDALAAIDCKGPGLRLLLVRDGQELTFRLSDPESPLSKRALSRIAVPPGASVQLLPFEKKAAWGFVDL